MISLKSNRAYARGLAVGVASLLTTALAPGATTTNAPASYCTAVGASLTVRSDGEVENRTAQTVTTLCPVERVASANTVSGTVFVTDRSTTAEVCCKLVAHTPDTARQDGATICSSGSATSMQMLTLPQMTLPYSYSHVVVECTIPAMSGGVPSRLQLVRTVQ